MSLKSKLSTLVVSGLLVSGGQGLKSAQTQIPPEFHSMIGDRMVELVNNFSQEQNLDSSYNIGEDKKEKGAEKGVEKGVEKGAEKGDNPEENKKEKSFTFKPIAISVGKSEIKNGDERKNNTTTTVEFAGGGKNLSLYGYARKDWNEYAIGFNEGIEIFGNESLKLGKNFDLNGKQFYWGKGNGRVMVGPQVSADKQFGNVGVGGSVGAYGTYDVIRGGNDKISGSSVVSVNFSVKLKNGKTWNGNAFLNISNIKNFNTSEYGTYGEASLESPNILNPNVAGALCGVLYARYGGSINNIDLNYLGVGLTYKF